MTPHHWPSSFLRYRFDYSSLVCDCFRAVLNNGFHWHARLIAFLGLPLLLAAPATILYVGGHPFGNPYWFGASLGLWPILLESFAYQLRQAAAAAVRPESPRDFDFFLFIIFTCISFAAAGVLFKVHTTGWEPKWTGVLWGATLAGGVDLARSAVAGALATMRGYPLYGQRPRKPAGQPAAGSG